MRGPMGVQSRSRILSISPIPLSCYIHTTASHRCVRGVCRGVEGGKRREILPPNEKNSLAEGKSGGGKVKRALGSIGVRTHKSDGRAKRDAVTHCNTLQNATLKRTATHLTPWRMPDFHHHCSYTCMCTCTVTQKKLTSAHRRS